MSPDEEPTTPSDSNLNAPIYSPDREPLSIPESRPKNKFWVWDFLDKEQRYLPDVVLNLCASIFFSLIFVYLAMRIISVLPLQPKYDNLRQQLPSIAGELASIAEALWEFSQPFLEIFLILAILDWLISKINILNIQTKRSLNNFVLDTQTLIALIVTGGFTIAALTGNDSGAGLLKDLSLVVVGFYFGTQRQNMTIRERQQYLEKQGGTSEPADRV